MHIFSAMEPCPTYEPWHDKKTGCTFIRRDRGKCLHYYFYFIDEMLGLCFLAVPTWCPFRALFRAWHVTVRHMVLVRRRMACDRSLHARNDRRESVKSTVQRRRREPMSSAAGALRSSTVQQ